MNVFPTMKCANAARVCVAGLVPLVSVVPFVPTGRPPVGLMDPVVVVIEA